MTRAADDFPAIRARLEELRRERIRVKAATRHPWPRRWNNWLPLPDCRVESTLGVRTVGMQVCSSCPSLAKPNTISTA